MLILTQYDYINLRAFTTDSACQLNILRHDRHTFSVDRAQVGVFKQANKVCFTSFLQSQNSTALEAQIRLEVLSDFANKALERKFPDEQLGTLLVPADLTKSYSSRSVPVGFLHATSSRSALASSFGCKLLARSLTSSGLTSGLLGTSHVGL